MITVLVLPDELAGQEVTLRGETYRHLFRARRVAAGERFRLVDGVGGARWGRVDQVGAKQARVVLGEPAPRYEATVRVEVIAPVPSGSRASWLVEKATEVGVSAVRWIGSERAPRDLKPSALERHVRVARAAVEQCHRCSVPEISGVHAWHELAGLIEAFDRRVVLDPAAGAWANAAAWDSAVVLVGPEGGWSESERQETEALGFEARSLGPTVLRIETAAVLGAAHLLGARRT